MARLLTQRVSYLPLRGRDEGRTVGGDTLRFYMTLPC